MHFAGIYEDEIKGKAYDSRLLLRFVKYLKPYKNLVFLSLVFMPAGIAAKLLQPWIIKQTIDGSIASGDLNGLLQNALMYLGVIAVEALFAFAEVITLQYLGQKIMNDVRNDLFSHLQGLSSSFFDKTATGGLVTRVTSDVEALGEMFSAGIITVAGDVLLLFGIVFTMLSMNWKLSLATFTVLPALFWITFNFRRKMRSAFRKVRGRLSDLNTFLNETIAGIIIVRLFNREKSETEKFAVFNMRYREANYPVITWDASLYAAVETVSSIAIALLVWYGGGEIVAKTLTFGALVAFIQYIEKFFSPIRDLSAKYSVMQGAIASLERIFNLLDTDERIREPENSVKRVPESFSDISFKDVWFAYNGEEYVLKNFSLEVKSGETVALVGETGGGKSTVTRLLSRLYDASGGSITLGGISIKNIPLDALRRKIGVVLQDPAIFTGTVRYNISLGEAEAESRVTTASRAVGALRFIENLPQGFDTELKEKGRNLSAGERQLISFARAIAFDPEILVLDEATASVDTESEIMIQQGILELMKGRTTLVVAHRLSTIRNADRIVVIHRGEKCEEGTHNELLAKGGIYSRLYRIQFEIPVLPELTAKKSIE